MHAQREGRALSELNGRDETCRDTCVWVWGKKALCLQKFKNKPFWSVTKNNTEAYSER